MVNPTYLVGIGGILGVILRYLVSQLIRSNLFPYNTLIVNILGSFTLGTITFLSVGNERILLLGTGACGSLTTFSSFSVDVVRLWEADRYVASAGYAILNILGALLAIGIASVLVQEF